MDMSNEMYSNQTGHLDLNNKGHSRWHEADTTHTYNEQYIPNDTYNNNEWSYHMPFAHDNASTVLGLSNENLMHPAIGLLHNPSELMSLQVSDILGNEFISDTDAEEFYKKYIIGFSMRKDRFCRDTYKLITIRRWVCSKEEYISKNYVDRTDRVRELIRAHNGLKLYEFMSHIDRAMSRLRNNELKDDFDSIKASEAKLIIVNFVDDVESVMYTFKKFAGGHKTWNVRYGALSSKCSKMCYFASKSTEGYKEANVTIVKLTTQMKGLMPSSSTIR
ncbi:hypothetical protein EZV62_001515 [Acer yangbiense]|uniref:Protein FAR1-RELATED SEQUENCE n=1 Tax=Acer yangbiense TaxID=1000413 RepID=A0A5C7IWQ4_9ROSI|nr:hypothetical protein EZV62_001515 [Acer yangbiense]